MDSIDFYRRLFAYDDWANREVLGALKSTGAAPPLSGRVMPHILAAELLWLARLEQRASPVPVWPDWTLDQCEARLGELPGAWAAYLNALTPPDLARTIGYTDSKGAAWTNRVGDVLMHVVMHSAYHRGQIASDLRAAGHTPVLTDFIHAVREGFAPERSAGS